MIGLLRKDLYMTWAYCRSFLLILAVFLGVGLCASAASILGHWLGAGLAIKNGSRIVRPTVILVLILLTLKVGSELLFPEFWA